VGEGKKLLLDPPTAGAALLESTQIAYMAMYIAE